MTSFAARLLLRRIALSQHKSQRRWLNLQEYQSKQLLLEHGCRVQRFLVAGSRSETEQQLPQFGKVDEYVVKAQVLAGGRGKGRFIGGPPDLGGVHISKSVDKALTAIDGMIGRRLVTKQTAKEGVLVEKIMLAEGVQIVRETYVAVLLDRESNGPVVVVSPAGGVDIEEVAERTPHLVHKEPVDIDRGLTREQALLLADKLKFTGNLRTEAAEQIERLYKLFISIDGTQIEINPFAETACGHVYCVDAKLNFDDAAAFRQQRIFAMGEPEFQDAQESEAQRLGLNYIGMDGNIGCLVNGAGLAMATMDQIGLAGGKPANFLDVGGAVTEKQVSEAFRIIQQSSKVQCILVNIFGGIVNCATIARGIVEACQKVKLRVPLVVRLEGTNVTEARKLLVDSSLPLISAADLQDAASRAVQAAATGTR